MSGGPPLRAGVIGLGWAGQQHMAAYDELDGVRLVGIAGMEAPLLRRFGDRYDVPHRAADWAGLLRVADLDVVSVATPTALHAPIAVAAIEAGVHVLSEKPMAEHAAAARRMVDAAVAHDRVLDVSFNHRNRGDVRALQAVVDAGLLGRVSTAKAGWLRREGIPGLGSWFTRKATAGGGPLMDLGVHMLDIALTLLGEPAVTAASAATVADFGPRGLGGGQWGVGPLEAGPAFEVEDLATAFLRLDGGGTLALEASWAQWIPHDRCFVELYGTDGGAVLEWGGGPGADRSLTVHTAVSGVPATLSPPIGPDGGHTASVAAFLAAVRSGDFAAHRGELPLRRAVVLDACYASAEAGREVAVGP